MSHSSNRRRVPVALVPLVAVVAAAVFGLNARSPVPVGAAKFPTLTGTWEGDYRFPSTDNTGVASHEKLVIDHQDGELLWGYDEFIDKTGATVRIPVRGSVDPDGKGFGLAETGGFFMGRLVGKRTMTVRFFLTTTTYTSFHATLTRAKR